MTVHVTIPIEDDELARLRTRAEILGLPVEQVLRALVVDGLSTEPQKAIDRIGDLLGFIPSGEGEPTDIGLDKDKLVGEAFWKGHLRTTRQTE